jgi:hypothetical protein
MWEGLRGYLEVIDFADDVFAEGFRVAAVEA